MRIQGSRRSKSRYPNEFKKLHIQDAEGNPVGEL